MNIDGFRVAFAMPLPAIVLGKEFIMPGV